MKREVTERDFRKPEFVNAVPEDYEFRDDGAIVRKDRWETGIRSIASILVDSRTEFEIPDIVERVRLLASKYLDWQDKDAKPLYTTPPQRTAAEGEDTRRAWVGLTQDQINNLSEMSETVAAVIATDLILKQKNGFVEEKNT